MAQLRPQPDRHQRHLALDGAVNFRDLGGYPAAGGRHVRWRRLFRADGLASLSPADRALVRRLGVATVIDLRSTYDIGPQDLRCPRECSGDRLATIARVGSNQAAVA